jgi:uncharacterized membrane protein YfhO
MASRQVNPARHYTFTSNSTSFTVDATGPGVVVLTETNYPDDFEVTVNGAPVLCVPVNHAFKGVFLSQAGTYQISFSYWPHRLGFALSASALGLLLGAFGLISLVKGERPVGV